jgi:hypothetical protein
MVTSSWWALPGAGDGAAPPETKKADVAEHVRVFRHVGLLVNGPPGPAGLPFT